MGMRDGDSRSLLVGRLLSTSGHALAWLGGLLMLAAAWNGYAALALREAGVVRDGIVSSVSSRYSDGVRVYRPTIAYTDVHGHGARYTPSGASNLWKPAVGDRVRLVHPADAPGDIHIDRGLSLFVLPMALAGAGGVFLLIGVCFRRLS